MKDYVVVFPNYFCATLIVQSNLAWEYRKGISQEGIVKGCDWGCHMVMWKGDVAWDVTGRCHRGYDLFSHLGITFLCVPWTYEACVSGQEIFDPFMALLMQLAYTDVLYFLVMYHWYWSIDFESLILKTINSLLVHVICSLIICDSFVWFRHTVV